MAFKTNIVSETTIIGLCLRDINEFHYIETMLSPEDFQHKPHSIMFDLMIRLSNKNVAEFTYNQLSAEAEAIGVVEEIGGYSEIKKIATYRKAGNITHGDRDVCIDRLLGISHCAKVKKLCEEQSEYFKAAAEKVNRDNVDDVFNTAMNDLLLFDDNTKNRDADISNTASFIENYVKTMDDIPSVELAGIPTGYPIFDQQINGLIPGSLTIIAADKKAGKSAFLMNIVAHVVVNLNTPVLYIDTEMSDTEFHRRFLANLSNVEERHITNINLDGFEKQKITEASLKIKDKKLIHCYMPGFTIDKITAQINRFYKMENVGLVIFDYIKEPEDRDRNRNEYQILGDVTTRLKDLAGKFNIPILTAAQLNRQGAIADSYKILRYADVICYWSYRTEEERKYGGGREGCGNFKLVIADSRRGGTTPKEGIGYKFYKKTMRVYEVPLENQVFFGQENNQDPEDMRDYLKEDYDDVF